MKIAVYGASGYTGRLVAAELRRRGIEAVLSGRDAGRLRETAYGLGGAEVRPAGAEDPHALTTVFRGCDAVINCASPFTAFGLGVVGAAVAAGCHYVDTSAEQEFLAGVFERFAGEAQRAGVAVVPAIGYDILPGDFVAHLAGTAIEPVEELVVAYDLNNFGMTRGTLRSAYEMLNGTQLGYTDGVWNRSPRPARRTAVRFPGETDEAPVMAWPGCEVVTVPRHVQTRNVEVVINAAAATPEFSQLLQAPPETAARVIDALPEGPAEHERTAATFTVLAEAVSADGRLARALIRGYDVYGSTAVMAVEGARRLVAGGDRTGVLSPAQAFDIADFLKFLSAHGFSYETQVAASRDSITAQA
ncbi:saccharopine dehydrogenase NADP-binding domain-containing protein [Dactylosporangium sp. NPDC049525]|uniref:saccharopine dehydrogenase family protein n=1 Tax=Dactylosporangium sp. NPDC049525 TaxID=3154730 RepID=UPI00341B45E8